MVPRCSFELILLVISDVEHLFLCLSGQTDCLAALRSVPIPVWPVVSCHREQVCPRLPASPRPGRGTGLARGSHRASMNLVRVPELAWCFVIISLSEGAVFLLT